MFVPKIVDHIEGLDLVVAPVHARHAGLHIELPTFIEQQEAHSYSIQARGAFGPLLWRKERALRIGYLRPGSMEAPCETCQNHCVL
jgi:hypothetical protein